MESNNTSSERATRSIIVIDHDSSNLRNIPKKRAYEDHPYLINQRYNLRDEVRNDLPPCTYLDSDASGNYEPNEARRRIPPNMSVMSGQMPEIKDSSQGSFDHSVSGPNIQQPSNSPKLNSLGLSKAGSSAHPPGHILGQQTLQGSALSQRIDDGGIYSSSTEPINPSGLGTSLLKTRKSKPNQAHGKMVGSEATKVVDSAPLSSIPSRSAMGGAFKSSKNYAMGNSNISKSISNNAFDQSRRDRSSNQACQPNQQYVANHMCAPYAINTKLAPPFEFNSSGVCDWCADKDFGLTGRGMKMITKPSPQAFTFETPTQMCASCTKARLRILNCPGHRMQWLHLGGFLERKPERGFVEVQDIQGNWHIQRTKRTEYWCSVCRNKALERCIAPDPFKPRLEAAQSAGASVIGCGLTLCGHCHHALGYLDGNLDALVSRVGEIRGQMIWGCTARADALLLRKSGPLAKAIVPMPQE